MTQRRYSIALYTWGDAPFEQVVAEAASAGFRFCELNQAVIDLTRDDSVRSVRAALAAHGLAPLTMHASGGRLAAADDQERLAAVRHVVRAFEGFAALGGETIVVHPSHPLKEGEAVGSLGKSKPDLAEMFEDVFHAPDWRVIEQRREVMGK